MDPTPGDIAQAISGHDFERALPFLAEDVVWSIPGTEGLTGKSDFVAACRATAAALVGTEVVSERFFVIDGGDRVAIDTLTRYRDQDGETTVASCDVYEFVGGKLARLTSYNIEA